MNDRPNDLLRIRPEIKKTMEFASMSAEERFQNETRRPILKFQNPLLLAVFHDYIQKRKGVFYTLNSEQKLDYIERSLSKDHAFRNLLVGMIVGHFTLEEYPVYKTSASALNKRMMTMAIERLKDQAQSFAAF